MKTIESVPHNKQVSVQLCDGRILADECLSILHPQTDEANSEQTDAGGLLSKRLANSIGRQW